MIKEVQLFVFLFSLLLSFSSYSDEQMTSIAHHINRTGNPQFAEKLLSKETNMISRQEYFNLLVSGSLGKIKLAEAEAMYIHFKEHPDFSSEMKAVLLFLNGDRKKAVDLIKDKKLILNHYAAVFLAKEYMKGDYVTEDYEKAHSLAHAHNGAIFEASIILATLELEKRRPYASGDNAIRLLVSSLLKTIVRQNSDIPSLLLIHLTQDGILMPKDNILSAAIALSTTHKTDRLIHAFNNIAKNLSIDDYYEAHELAQNIKKEAYDNEYKFIDYFVLGNFTKRMYRIKGGPRSGATIDYPAYNIQKIIAGFDNHENQQ